MNGLSEIATILQDMRPEIQRMADAVTATTLRDVTRYIATADLRSCKQIVDALIVRQVEELGCAPGLEDAACDLADAINGGIEE